MKTPRIRYYLAMYRKARSLARFAFHIAFDELQKALRKMFSDYLEEKNKPISGNSAGIQTKE